MNAASIRRAPAARVGCAGVKRNAVQPTGKATAAQREWDVCRHKATARVTSPTRGNRPPLDDRHRSLAAVHGVEQLHER